MDCYKIARRIMDRIRCGDEKYRTQSSAIYHDVWYYDDSAKGEYFSISYHGVIARIMNGKLYKIEIEHPRGLVIFNLYLWLLETYKIVK